MVLRYRAAVLHAPQTPLSVETVTAASLKPTDVLVRIRAAGLCHTDLEVIEGSLRYPLPIVLGHEAAGVVDKPVRPRAASRLATTSCCRGIRIAGIVFIATAIRRSCARSISAADHRDGRSMAKAAPCWPTAASFSS